MANTIRTYTVTIGKVYNGSVECTNPIVEIAGQSDIAINCTDPECGIYTVQVGPEDIDPCIKFIVSCGECDVCPPQIIEKCFCDSDADCDTCEECIGGICQAYCEYECDPTTGECYGGDNCPTNTCTQNADCQGASYDDCICVESSCTDCEECVNNSHCSNGKICKSLVIDGEICRVCRCPDNLVEVDGECVECATTDDCSGVCEQCLGGDCVQIDCGNGFCDPISGDCVDCVSSGDCGVNECCVGNECDCCPGFTDINGVCTAVDCQFDTDCGVCEICSNNLCIPQQCPSGQVPIVVGNQCICGEECDCDVPDCSSQFDACVGSANVNVCGCAPCQGTCDSGCEAPCVCDEATQACVFDSCSDQPCDNGTDCPIGCGCYNGECVSCTTLSCLGVECDNALGCECEGNTCTYSGGDCPPTPCDIASDCPFGCTCYEGICTSCTNFSCATDECATQAGCECVGNTCQGTYDDCSDIVTLEKSDSECTLTGALEKDNCCSCSAMTFDIKNTEVHMDAAVARLLFIGEIRKGAYDGISVDSNPRVDDFSNINIAENEPPIAGTFQLSYTVEYKVYNLVNQGGEIVPVYAGTTTSSPVTQTRTFPATGTSGQVSFSFISIPLIGTEETIGNQLRVVNKAQITFSSITTVVFPNDCTYLPIVIGKYDVTNNDQFNSLSALGKTATSGDCRKPFFKWTKSGDSSFDEAPFRKIYADAAGSNVWEDTLVGLPDDDLESCYYYLFEPDCTCEDPKSEYVVFCSPEDINFRLQQCNTEFILLTPFEPCNVNDRSNFYYTISGGTGSNWPITFAATNPPINQIITSENEIEEVTYSISCDVAGQCTKTYQVQSTPLEIDVETDCDPDGGSFIATFIPPGTCGVNKITILETGQQISGVLQITLPVGTYTAEVDWACGCDSEPVIFSADCCEEFILSACYRECDGTIIGCQNDAGVDYYINGSLLTNTLHQYVSSLQDTQAALITAKQGSCVEQIISLLALDQICCADFSAVFDINPDNATNGTVTVYNYTDVTVTTSQYTAVVADQGDGEWLIANLTPSTTVTITVTDALCGSLTLTIEVPEDGTPTDDCGLNVAIQDVESEDCYLEAQVDQTVCECPEPSVIVDITNVVDAGDDLEVYYETEYVPVDADAIAGQIVLEWYDEDFNVVTYNTGFLNGSGSQLIPKLVTTSTDCVDGLVNYELDGADIFRVTLPNGVGVGDLLSVSGVNVTIASISMTFNGLAAVQEFSGSFISTAFNVGDIITVVITIEDTDGAVYEGQFITYPLTYGKKSIVASSFLCEIDTVSNAPRSFKVIVRGLATEDNCVYADKYVLFSVSAPNVVTPNPPRTIVMEAAPGTEYNRWVRFDWWKQDDGREYREFHPTTSTITPALDVSGFQYLEQGSTYQVTATCGDCESIDTDVYCCIPVIDVTMDDCNDNAFVTLTGLSGSYRVTIGTSSAIVVIPDDGDGFGTSAVTTVTGPIESSVGTYEPLGVSACAASFSVPLVTVCTPVFTAGTCVDPGRYDLTITGCGPDPLPNGAADIISGTFDSVSGNTIIGISKDDPVSFIITDADVCHITVDSTDIPNPCTAYVPPSLQPPSSSLPLCDGEPYDPSTHQCCGVITNP